jgi:hypothetical protein
MSWAALEASWGGIKAAWSLAELAGVAAKASESVGRSETNPDEILCMACQIWIEVADEARRR